MIPLDISFTAPLHQEDSPGGWTIVVLADSGKLLGTHRSPRRTGRVRV